LPASYANFYIGNTKVLVPLFGTEADPRALDVIQSVFPDRRVVGINAAALVYGLGTFHCMSQQQPAI
jgi:agmatine deiminase